jgi:uncharacterized membrane protein
MTTDAQINEYLSQLRAALTGLTVSDREDIVEEIRMHIRERLEDPRARVEDVLAGLGSANELAQQYRTGMLVQRARTSISPIVILRAALRWATMGIGGFIVFLVAVVGYATGGAFLIMAMLKPIFPANTGLWVGPTQFNFSFYSDAMLARFHPPVHEVLGWWFLPVALVLGSVLLAGTTKLLQFLFGRFRRKVPFAAAPHATPAMLLM